jgi:predicted  nucleic acid-binding Zn-ribbon protein
MCDDSVANKHSIREFDKLLTSCVENNNGNDDFFVVQVTGEKKVKFLELSEAVNQVGGSQEMKEEMAAMKEEFRKEVALLKEDAKKSNQQTNQLKEETNQLKEENNQLKQETNQLKAETNQLKQEANQLKEEAKQSREKANQLEQETNLLKTQVAKEKESNQGSYQRIQEEIGTIKQQKQALESKVSTEIAQLR